jgi:hypothetical protein
MKEGFNRYMKSRWAMNAGIIIGISCLLALSLAENSPHVSPAQNQQGSTSGPVNMKPVTLYSGQPFYPTVPDKITSPEMAIQAYFDALYFAANLNLAQMEMAGGTVSYGLIPYPTAYGYWSKERRAKQSYEQFLASWEGTAQVELLKMLPAGRMNTQRRFFVETKDTRIIEDEGIGIFYYSGVLTVGKTLDGWRLTGGKLAQENMAWELGGHSAWRADPVQVAENDDTVRSIMPPLGNPVLQNNNDGSVTVKFLDKQKQCRYEVTLFKLQEGTYQVIEQGIQ